MNNAVKQKWKRCSSVAIVALLWMPTPGTAQQAEPDASAQAQNQVQMNQGTRETMVITVGRSEVIQAPWPVAKVSVAEPKIADVQVVTPEQVLVLAQTVGSTDLILWSEQGELWRREVRVMRAPIDLQALDTELDRLFPNTDLEVSDSQGVMVVRGTLNRAEDAQRLDALLSRIEAPYVDLTSVAGGQQVLIQVKVAEASREAIRALNVNWVSEGSDFVFGNSTGGGSGNVGAIGSIDGDVITSASSVLSGMTLFGSIPNADLRFFLEALVDNQYMRILAEPSLVALSGEEASFLVGGEFPIPVVQGSTGGDVAGGTSITIEFKEFGVRLQFRPTVLGDGTIRLKVAPEVSDITDIGSVEIQGFSIPALTTRRAETTLQMRSGQSFAMAGLIDRSVTARTEKVPGLGEMPVLGSLFRSVRYQRGETEMVVVATVTLVEPTNTTADRPLPGDLHQPPSDWELYAQGRIHGRNPARLSDAHARRLKEMGLNNLKGPGAWDSHVQDKAGTERE